MGIFERIKKVWSQDMAIDLGTANTLVVVKEYLLKGLNDTLKKILAWVGIILEHGKWTT